MMSTQPKHVTAINGNIFLDLGFLPEEASTLQAESNQIISEKLALINESMIKTHKSTD